MRTVGSNALALDWLSSGASNAILGGGALGSMRKAHRRAGSILYTIMHELFVARSDRGGGRGGSFEISPSASDTQT